MEINLNQEQGAQVLNLAGKFDTASAVEKEAEFMALVGDGSDKFLVDFSAVPYIASSGLRILLKIAQAIKAGGGDLYLCSLNSTIAEVFEISGFDKILNVSENKKQVFASF
jgi:anti-sigma B factor antagonist